MRKRSGTFHEFTKSSIDWPAFFAARTDATKSRMNSEYIFTSALVTVVLKCPVMTVSMFEHRAGLGDRVGVGEAAAAVVDVHDRHALVRERVARVHRAQRGEDHERVAARVRAAEVAQLDPVVAAADRQSDP